MRHKGVTLIELLIVIVVVGILATAIMLSSTEAVTTAKVTKIISDMNMLAKAANAWYLDNYKRIEVNEKQSKVEFWLRTNDGSLIRVHDYLMNNPSEFAKYMSNSSLEINKARSTFSSWDSTDPKNKRGADDYYAPIGGYSIYVGYSNTVCYVVYGISEKNDAKQETKLKQKLKARAKSAGLLWYNFSGDGSSGEYDGVKANVFMEAFRFSSKNITK